MSGAGVLDDRPGDTGRPPPARPGILVPGWGWALLAALAAEAAVIARPDVVVAAALATVAVASGAMIVRRVLGPRTPPTPEVTGAMPLPLSDVRDAFLCGRLGREDLVFLLDRIERSGPRPELPFRRPAEVQRIVSFPPDDFLRYLEARVAALEDTP